MVKTAASLVGVKGIAEGLLMEECVAGEGTVVNDSRVLSEVAKAGKPAGRPSGICPGLGCLGITIRHPVNV